MIGLAIRYFLRIIAGLAASFASLKVFDLEGLKNEWGVALLFPIWFGAVASFFDRLFFGGDFKAFLSFFAILALFYYLLLAVILIVIKLLESAPQFAA